MISYNNMKVGIQKSWYNRTIVQEDGVTQLVDTSKQYPLYQLHITKSYFDTDINKLLPEIISDLQDVIGKLQEIQRQEEIEKEENCK